MPYDEILTWALGDSQQSTANVLLVLILLTKLRQGRPKKARRNGRTGVRTSAGTTDAKTKKDTA